MPGGQFAVEVFLPPMEELNAQILTDVEEIKQLSTSYGGTELGCGEVG